MLDSTDTLNAAILAAERTPVADVRVDWQSRGATYDDVYREDYTGPGDEPDDLTGHVSSVRVTRELNSPLPLAATFVAGHTVAEAQVEIVGDSEHDAAWLYSPFNPASPTYGQTVVAKSAQVRLGFVTEAGREFLPQLVGRTRSLGVQSTAGGSRVVLDLLDMSEALRGKAVLPFADNRVTGFDGAWCLDQLLRGAGVHCTPADRGTARLAVTCHGSLHPHLGTLDAVDAAPPESGLAATRAALNRAGSERVNILVYGDSVGEGAGATALANRWLDRLQTRLRGDFPAAGTLTEQPSYTPAYYSMDDPVDWLPWESPARTAGAETQESFGLGGRSVTLNAVGEQVTFTGTGTKFRLHYGKTDFFAGWLSVTIDGGTPDVFTTYDAAAVGGVAATWDSGALSLAEHTVVVAYDNTDPGNTSWVLGAEFFNGDETTGVHVFDASHGGWTADLHRVQNMTPVAVVDPTLAIIALGWNDAGGGYTPAQFATALDGLIDNIRAEAADCDILLVAYPTPSFAEPDWNTPDWDAYVAAMSTVAAATTGCEMLNLVGVMPTIDDDAAYYGDLIHPSDLGHAFIADAIGDLLATPASGEPTFEAGPWGPVAALRGVRADYTLTEPLPLVDGTILVEGWWTLDAGQPVVGLWSLGSDTGQYVRAWVEADGDLYVELDWGGGNNLYPGGTVTFGQRHYIAVHVDTRTADTVVTTRIDLLTQVESANPTRAAGWLTTGTLGWGRSPTMGTVDGFQVAADIDPTWNDGHTPAAYLDPSLNALQVTPTVSGSAWEQITAVAEAEFGTVEFDETGVLRFRNRDRWRKAPASVVARTVVAEDAVTDLQISETVDGVRNTVRVPVSPPARTDPGVVWSRPPLFAVPAVSYRTITVQTPGPVSDLATAWRYAPSAWSSQRTITDGCAVTAGARTVTAPSGTFQSGDAGRRVVITGAGSGGGNLTTVVQRVVYTTRVEVRDPAGTTVTNSAATIYSLDAYTEGAGSVSEFRANSRKDGRGEEFDDGSVSVVHTERIGTDRVAVTLRNSNGGPAYMVGPDGTPAMWLYGQLWDTDAGASTVVERTDEASVRTYGQQVLDLPASVWRQDDDSCLGLVVDLLGDLSVARPVVEQVSIVADPRLQLGDRVRLMDRQGTLLDAEFWVMASSVTVGTSMRQDLTLRAAQRSPFPGWVLGVTDDLGIETTLY